VREAEIVSGRRYSEAIVRADVIALIVLPLESTLPHIESLVDCGAAVLLHGIGAIDPAPHGQQKPTDMIFGIVSRYDQVELAIVRATTTEICIRHDIN